MTSKAIMSNSNLIALVGQIIIVSLIVVLIGREYMPLVLKPSDLEQQKTLFLVKCISRIAVCLSYMCSFILFSSMP